MDDITTRIKEYVLIINSTLVDDDFLDFVIESVIDKFLAYTNREQLIVRYEDDLINHPPVGYEEPEDTFWDNYESYPIPPRLERTLAQVVCGLYKTIQT